LSATEPKKRIPDEAILFIVKRSPDGNMIFFNAPKAKADKQGGSIPWELLEKVHSGEKQYAFVLKTRPKA